jgi:hypothetical protein
VAAVSDGTPVSVRLPADVLQALRQHAEANGETLSDALRTGALMLLGICPTCGQKAPAPAGNEPEGG